MAFRDLIDDLHERLAERGWNDVRPPYGFVLLAARERSTTAAELATLLGISKQATSQLLDAMSSANYVRREPSAVDARQRAVVLTARGRELLAAVEAVYQELDDEWAEIIGRSALESLRTAITQVLLDRHRGQLPPVRPGW
jgi:DNA-binding MarR family transcriptional regulator